MTIFLTGIFEVVYTKRGKNWTGMSEDKTTIQLHLGSNLRARYRSQVHNYFSQNSSLVAKKKNDSLLQNSLQL